MAVGNSITAFLFDAERHGARGSVAAKIITVTAFVLFTVCSSILYIGSIIQAPS